MECQPYSWCRAEKVRLRQNTYWYPRRERLGIEDMVWRVLCAFAIEGGEGRLCEVQLAHVSGLQLVTQALCEVANACKTVAWTSIRNRFFWSRRDCGDGVEELLVQAGGIHAFV